jgi:hypothetical protein
MGGGGGGGNGRGINERGGRGNKYLPDEVSGRAGRGNPPPHPPALVSTCRVSFILSLKVLARESTWKGGDYYHVVNSELGKALY